MKCPDWLYYKYTDRVWVCCCDVIDDCETVDMTDSEIAPHFLGLAMKFACGANGDKVDEKEVENEN